MALNLTLSLAKKMAKECNVTVEIKENVEAGQSVSFYVTGKRSSRKQYLKRIEDLRPYGIPYFYHETGQVAALIRRLWR